jgi:multicomponent Na+:H+ antiporter subunit D
MVMGLAFFTAAGIAAVVFSMVHHIVVKTTLFLTGGLIEEATGSSRLSRIGDLLRTSPPLAVLFLLPALSLAGVPPLSGFVSKLALIDAGIGAGQYAAIGVSLVVGLLTLFSMLRIWVGVFWKPAADGPPPASPPAPARIGAPVAMVVPTVFLVAVSLAVAAAAGPIYDFSRRTAEDLLDPGRYIATVLER